MKAINWNWLGKNVFVITAAASMLIAIGVLHNPFADAKSATADLRADVDRLKKEQTEHQGDGAQIKSMGDEISFLSQQTAYIRGRVDAMAAAMGLPPAPTRQPIQPPHDRADESR